MACCDLRVATCALAVHFSLYAGGFKSVPHVYVPSCVRVCVCVLERVLCSVSCALIILPGVVAERQIIHGPANQAERQARSACTGYLRGNDLACVCVCVRARAQV